MAEKAAHEERILESLLRKLHSHKKRRSGKGKMDTKKEGKGAQKEDIDAEKVGEKDEAWPTVPSAAKEPTVRSTSASPTGEKKKNSTVVLASPARAVAEAPTYCYR
ncbi:hypothetical protein BDQ17DRAFT_1425555 [Cyathus striatus]|nr:hypothetical protein BDQ17DRAFT_1425555 [Cyathus striatus]